MNIRQLRLPFALALALGASSAHALGLGQIQVKSGLNEPLVAEIPIISAAPGELEELEVRLASPEAFARVGLERPVGLTANLQMSIGRNAAGQPVIRVTTPARFNEPVLTFLLEADWGRGSLVREFSALVDPPYIAPAVIRPLEAPSVAVAPQAPAPVYQAPEAQTAPLPDPDPVLTVTVVEPDPLPPEELAPEPLPEPAPEPVPQVVEAPPPAPEPAPVPQPQPAPEPEPEPEPIVAAPPPPAPQPQPVPAPPPPAPQPQPVPAPPPPPAADSFGPVADGQTLWSIANAARPDSSVNMNQMMLALQRANPEAFIDDNINLLKRGAVLRIPSRDEVATLSAAEAAVLVREQAMAWQSRRQPVPQPAEAVASAPVPARPAAQRPPVPDGRLEIVPPSGDELAARGVQSGASGEGSGAELRTELTQTREDLAARESEVAELRSQLTELEEQQADSQRLVEMQSSQLKALQDRLGDEPAAPAPAAAESAPQAPEAWYMNPLLWGGGLLVLLGGLVMALRGGRRASPVPVVTGRRISEDDALHASLAAGRRLPEPEEDEEPEEATELSPEDEARARLQAAVEANPDDLETHIALLRHLYSRGENAAYEIAAQAMRIRVRSTLDPRWREAVVMGVAVAPGNPLFSQAGWNAPRFGDTGVIPATPATPAAPAAPAIEPVPELDLEQVPVPEQAPAPPPVEDEEWDHLVSAAGDLPSVELDEVVTVDEPESEPEPAALDDDGSDTKIELAKAYLDIGDVEGAKGMLEEVRAEAGPAGRAEAERLLREIG